VLRLAALERRGGEATAGATSPPARATVVIVVVVVVVVGFGGARPADVSAGRGRKLTTDFLDGELAILAAAGYQIARRGPGIMRVEEARITTLLTALFAHVTAGVPLVGLVAGHGSKFGEAQLLKEVCWRL
jgi:hypothetical protein